MLFALGTIAHEMEFVLEQVRAGPFVEYMERWTRVIPTSGIGSAAGVGLHAANVALSLLLLVVPARRELLCLLALTFWGSQLASPDRIASHNGLMAAGLSVVLLLGVGEWLERWAGRAAPRRTGIDWYGWTLTGLVCTCTLTYFFAFFYKLNPVWFSPQSAAPGFLLRPLTTVFYDVGSFAAARSVLTGLAIGGTLLIELLLPVLLLVPSTRVLGCLVGLVFHLPMLLQGVVDFPVLIVAFYAAFLTTSQARELVTRCLARPPRARLAGTALLGSLWLIQRDPKANWMYGGGLELDPVLLAAHSVAGLALFLALVHVALTIGAWLVGSRGRWTPPGPVAGERARRWSALGLSAVLLVGAGLVYANLARFVGLPAAGAMIMFSGIAADVGNHVVVARRPIIRGYSYAVVVRFEPHGVDTREAREFGTFVRWLGAHRPPFQLNLNHVRYHMSRICASAGGAAVALGLRTQDGEVLDYEDVCGVPAMLRYSTIPMAPCIPDCRAALARWAKGLPPAD